MCICRLQSHTVSGIVNSVFACEVFLKALLMYYGVSKFKEHDLKGLWLELVKRDEDTAELIKKKYKRVV